MVKCRTWVIFLRIYFQRKRTSFPLLFRWGWIKTDCWLDYKLSVLITMKMACWNLQNWFHLFTSAFYFSNKVKSDDDMKLTEERKTNIWSAHRVQFFASVVLTIISWCFPPDFTVDPPKMNEIGLMLGHLQNITRDPWDALPWGFSLQKKNKQFLPLVLQWWQ